MHGLKVAGDEKVRNCLTTAKKVTPWEHWMEGVHEKFSWSIVRGRLFLPVETCVWRLTSFVYGLFSYNP